MKPNSDSLRRDRRRSEAPEGNIIVSKLLIQNSFLLPVGHPDNVIEFTHICRVSCEGD